MRLLVLLAAALPAAPAAALAAKRSAKGLAIRVSSGRLTLALSAPAWASINSAGASPGATTTTALAPASVDAAGRFSFPIARGRLDSVTGHGSLSSRGGLMIERQLGVVGLLNSSSRASAGNPALTLGDTSAMTLTSPNFTPSTVQLFTLRMHHARVLAGPRAIAIANVTAALTVSGAQLFGGSFRTGQTIGTVSVLARR